MAILMITFLFAAPVLLQHEILISFFIYFLMLFLNHVYDQFVSNHTLMGFLKEFDEYQVKGDVLCTVGPDHCL